MAASMDSVAVAVRMRNWPKKSGKAGEECDYTREEKVIDHIEFIGDTIVFTNGDGKTKDYPFTYCFWSLGDPNYPHDPEDTQESVYGRVGQNLLDAIWQGFNVCMFAYGMSGSGKSFSVVGVKGVPALAGMMPRLCTGIVKRIAEEKKTVPENEYKVTCRMVEDYIGDVFDLLEKNKKKQKKELKFISEVDRTTKLRVPKLIKGRVNELPLQSEEDLWTLLKIGKENQHIHATVFNPESSRGHTCFSLRFNKKNKLTGAVRETSVTLVDLCGSEDSGTLGLKKGSEEFKQCSYINMSLNFLAMVTNGVGKAFKKKTQKDINKSLRKINLFTQTALNKLLMEALIGQCRCVLFAAVRPEKHHVNYTEKTLKYAEAFAKCNRPIKAVKMKGGRNSAATGQKMAAMSSEIQKILEQKLAGKESMIAELQKQLADMAEEMERQKAEEAEEDAEEARLRAQVAAETKKRQDQEEAMKTIPHLSAVYPYSWGFPFPWLMREAENKMGALSFDESPKMQGPEIQDHHSTFLVGAPEDGKSSCSLRVEENGIKTFVNGDEIQPGDSVVVHHMDRLAFGMNFFLFTDPIYHQALDDDAKIEDEKMRQSWMDWHRINREIVGDSVEKKFFGSNEKNEALEKQMEEQNRKYMDLQEKIKDRKEEEFHINLGLKKKLEIHARKTKKQMDALQTRLANEPDKKSEIEALIAELEAASAAKAEQLKLDHQNKLDAILAAINDLKEQQSKVMAMDEEKRKELQRAREVEALKAKVVNEHSMVERANIMADRMKLPVNYSLKIMPAEFGVGHHDSAQLFIVCTDQRTKYPYFWPKEEFDCRLIDMTKIFNEWRETKQNPASDAEMQKSFFDSPSRAAAVGESHISLMLPYNLVEEEDFHPVFNYKGQEMCKCELKFELDQSCIPAEILDKRDEVGATVHDWLRHPGAEGSDVYFNVQIKMIKDAPKALDSNMFASYSLPMFCVAVEDPLNTQDIVCESLAVDVDSDDADEKEMADAMDAAEVFGNTKQLGNNTYLREGLAWHSFFTGKSGKMGHEHEINYYQKFRAELTPQFATWLKTTRFEVETWGSRSGGADDWVSNLNTELRNVKNKMCSVPVPSGDGSTAAKAPSFIMGKPTISMGELVNRFKAQASLSGDELTSKMKDFKMVDANDDGKVSWVELESAMRKIYGEAGMSFDGFMHAYCKAHFHMLDVNNDGFLSPDEFMLGIDLAD